MECLKIQVQKRENGQRVKACLPGKQSGEELFLKLNKCAFCDKECYDPASVLVPLRYFALKLENT